MLIYLITEQDAKSGLGLKEYLDFIEDEGMQPIMAADSHDDATRCMFDK